jgi:hypothetical protein
VGALAALLLACSPVDYRDADLQLDLPGQVPAQAEQVRVCIGGVGEQTFGARMNGLFAVTGLPAGQAVDVTVDVLEQDLVIVQGAVQALTDYAVGTRIECDEQGCTPCAEPVSFATAEEDTWVLALRFLG